MSPDYVRLAWEMLGYLLYSGNPLQKAFMFHGTGANGKTTLVRVISHMLGAGNTSTQSLDALSTNRFAPSLLFGKIANLAGDIDATFQESTAMFKMLTGEDRISGEHKYGDGFSFNCWAVPVFSANKIPGSADVSVGYLRRWVSLEFDKSFEGAPILNLSDHLAREADGIAASTCPARQSGAGRSSPGLSIRFSSGWTSAACQRPAISQMPARCTSVTAHGPSRTAVRA
jgi:putative DNA primase/helicase